jgi:Spy/CpxP family protein refolding chaperone
MGDRTMTTPAPRIKPPSPRRRGATALIAFLAACVIAAAIPFTDAEAQARRARRLQKRIEQLKQQQGVKKLNPDDNVAEPTEPAETPPAGAPGAKNNPKNARGKLEGIRDRGLRGFFTPEEREMIIQGFGAPASLMIVFRQLDLTPEQRQEIKAIRTRIGTRLALLQTERQMYDTQLTEAIYGENFDPKKVDEIAAQVADRQSQITKLRASIESQLRQVMTPDQFYVFHWLIGEMVVPQRRIPQAQLRQMMQRRTPPPQ